MSETPREPDRSYDAAHELWKRLQDQGTSNQIGILIAALRAEAADALERAAQEYGTEDLANIKVYCRHVAQRLRALASPAAAPAAELVHYVTADEPVGFLFCGPTVWESSRTDRVATNRKLVTCPNCLSKLAARTSPGGEGT